jgi:hypothetical protein
VLRFTFLTCIVYFVPFVTMGVRSGVGVGVVDCFGSLYKIKQQKRNNTKEEEWIQIAVAVVVLGDIAV